VLAPLLFTAYASPVSNVIEDHRVSYHQFADDAQLYIVMNAAETTSTLDCLACCTDAVKRWLVLNDLQLNSDKSEVVVFGTTAQLQSIASVKTVDITGCSLPVKCTVKSLGVILDSHLNFNSHAKSVVAACNFHTRSAPYPQGDI